MEFVQAVPAGAGIAVHGPRAPPLLPPRPLLKVLRSLPARVVHFVVTSLGMSGNNSVVECDLAKVEVAGSNPVSRSTFRS